MTYSSKQRPAGMLTEDADALSKGEDGDERYLVPALMRGMEALRAFSSERRNLSLSELAAAIGVTRSAAYRIVYTLDHLEFLSYDPKTRTYALGPLVLQLGFGYLASRDLVEVATPHLEQLRDCTDWSAHLAELQGTEALYLARVPTRRSVASTVHVGTRLPAHATAMGRALLCALSDEEIITRFSRDALKLYTELTPNSVQALLVQLRAERANGFVIQMSGYETGVAGIAAPVRDASGRVVAAVNVAAVVPSLESISVEIQDAVRRTASEISRDLGARTS